jgi:hypothetical protein
MERRDHMEDLGVDADTIKMYFRIYNVLMWPGFNSFRLSSKYGLL